MNPITVWCPTCGGRGTVPVVTLVGFIHGRRHTRAHTSALVICETCDGCGTLPAEPWHGPDDVAPAARSAQHPTRYPSYP